LAAHDLVPLGVHFELTRACNLACYHCYVVDDDGRLPTARWLELVDEVAEQGCLSVTLTGGEVMLHPDWLRRLAVRRRMLLGAAHHGTLLDEALMTHWRGSTRWSP
jgi:MoaA/NifB/PqqE/SkfB family radical SAM enzyme